MGQGMLRFSFSSLRVRLLLLVLLAVIPALGLILYTGFEQRRLAAGDVKARALRLVHYSLREQDLLIGGARQLLVTLAHLPEVRSGDSAACNALFAKLEKQFQYYINFGTIKPNGDLSCSAIPFSGQINAADRLYFRRAIKARDFAIGEYQIGRVTKKPTINFGYPVLAEAGRLQAVVFAALDLAWLNHLAAKAQLPPGSVVTVIDQKGTILARHPDPDKWVGQPMPEAPIVKTMLAQREGVSELPGIDGVPRLFAFAPLQGGVTSAVGIPKAAALAPVNRLLARNLALLGLVTLLAMGAAWIGGDLFIRRRVNTLVDATKRLTGGDLSARTGIATGEGELDHLARAFDEMAEGLEGQIAERRQAEHALRQQLSRIGLLNQITRAVAERQDLESIFRIVLSRLEDHLPVDFGVAMLYDAGADTLALAASGPKSQPLATAMGLLDRTMIPLEESGLRACVQGETVYAPTTAGVDARIPRSLAEHGLRAMIATPLIAEGKTFGMLVLARQREQGFNSAEGEFSRSLGEHVALAGHQARLQAQLQQAYDELRHTREAMMQQERLRALGQMASGVAHDINNALSPVVGYSELLLENEANLSDRAKRYLNSIKMAGTDIANIIARMREFYRQREADEALLPVSLNRVVEQVIDLTRPRWHDIPLGRGIVIEIKTDLRHPLPGVMAVESELREALTNLVLNAVDAMPEGGTMTLRTDGSARAYGGGGDGPPSQVIVEVSDTGTGMDEETRRHCLEPFYSTKGDRGTGLGLAMVFGIMQRHEGEIDIESEVSKGTTVRLIFPIREPAQASALATVEAATPVSPLRILCIDDDPMLRHLMKELLEKDGHTVELAGGGQEGLDAFRAAKERDDPFDILITDIGMPYMDGREVARTVKRESPTTPVILLSGWGRQMKAEGDVPAEAHYVLSKPPRIHELRQVLSTIRTTRAGSKA
jgi:signal transduction histidine kinase/ActR/RegA family two-component response regulator/HAMP domain-containing protein